VLKSARPIPAGAQLKCPKCQTTFKTPVEEEELVEPEIEEPEEQDADDFDDDDDDPPPRRGAKSARTDDDEVDDLDELDELDELDDDEPPRKKRSRRDDDDDLDDEDDRPRGKSKRARADEDDEDEDRPSKKKSKSKKKKKSKSNAGLIIGLAAGGGLAVVAVIGLILFFVFGGSGLRSQLIGTWQVVEADGKPLPGFVSMNMVFTSDGELKMSGMGREITMGKFQVSGTTLSLEGNQNTNMGPGGIPGGAAQIEIRGDQLILTGTDGGREKKLVLKKRNP